MAKADSTERRRRPGASVYDHYASLPPDTDFRQRPDLYRVGRGEQGVLMVEPYKSELLPLWRFKDVETAERSAAALHREFKSYQRAGDFVGMDMARKFIQMGYTRARRYANHAGGRKYAHDGTVKPRSDDAVKADAARVFYEVWKIIRTDEQYLTLKREHQRLYG